MPRKRQHKPRQGLDTEVVREIERQTQKQQEIENRQKKRKLIFWSIAIFGTVVISAIVCAFLLLLGMVEW